MYNILISVFSKIFPWLLRAAVIKALVFSFMYVVLTFVLNLVVKYLPDFTTGTLGNFSFITPMGWYLIDLTNAELCLQMVLSALVTRLMLKVVVR